MSLFYLFYLTQDSPVWHYRNIQLALGWLQAGEERRAVAAAAVNAGGAGAAVFAAAGADAVAFAAASCC